MPTIIAADLRLLLMLHGAVIKHVLDHVVYGPTVTRIEIAGRLSCRLTFRGGVDRKQTEKLADSTHGNMQGRVLDPRGYGYIAELFCALLESFSGLVADKAKKLNMNVPTEIVVWDQASQRIPVKWPQLNFTS
jgi:hypothetical protein